MTLKIGSHFIGREHRPFVVAELSGNHDGRLEQALAILDAAADAGAHALKLQTFDADSMTLRSDAPAFRVDAEHGLWGGRRLWDLYDEGKTPLEWHRPLFERARTRGILCFSTPFDEKAVDFLEEFEPPAYKIASFECIDLPLIRYVASTRRPLILSTGMASLGEIERAVETARAAGCEQLVLLKCTSTYPADPVNTNLRAIPLLRECFGCEVGLSDHTGGVGAAVAAVALGATFIEKHFTISRAAGGVDAAFSLEPPELRALVVETERAWQALGTPRVGPTRAELASLRYRRSIFVSRDVRAGEPFTRENLRRVRPADGLDPQFFEQILGRVAGRDIAAGTPLEWSLVGGPSPDRDTGET
ncbi:MAG: pseudaminic acid synthase [Deltaproteobacteria bacterium]|jgi:pseudaminic acid synthase